MTGPKVPIPSESNSLIKLPSLLPLPSSKNLDDGNTASLCAIPGWLSPSPHRTPPCALLLVSAGLQKGWLLKHGLSFPTKLLLEHGPVSIPLTRRPPMRLDRIGFALECSLAPSGVVFKSLRYVSQPRVEASRVENSCVRPPRREVLSESSQQSTIKNATQVLLGTQ